MIAKANSMTSGIMNPTLRKKIKLMEIFQQLTNHWRLVLATVIMGVVLSACGNPKETNANASDDVMYETSPLAKKVMSSELHLPGELEGYYETGIMAKVNGYIKVMKVDIGDVVKEGQLIAELEAPELVSQLTTAYAEHQSKEAIFFNTKGKFKRLILTNKTPGAVSPYDMDLSRTTLVSDSLAYLAAQSRYEAVKQLTNYLQITAPFAGVITDRPLAPGAFVGPGDNHGIPLYKLKAQSKLRLHISIPEKYIAEVKKGEAVSFNVKSYPGEVFEGKITRLSRNLNIQTRSEIVEIEIRNDGGKLLPGMYAITTIPIARPGLSFVVPKTAIITNMEKQFVIRVNKNMQAEHVEVEKGVENASEVEVFGRLDEGDKIIDVASDEIRNGDTVKVKLVAEVKQ